MDFVKSIGHGVWGILGTLVGLALFVAVAIPLGSWFWGWLGTDSNAVIVVAAVAIVAGGKYLCTADKS